MTGRSPRRPPVGPTMDEVRARRAAERGGTVSPESAATVRTFQRQMVLVHVRALRRSARRLPWWRRPAFWLRIWRETT